MNSPRRVRLVRRLFLALIYVAPIWAATSWIAGTGPWTAFSNWSNGVPAAGVDFVVDNGGTAEIGDGVAASARLGSLGSAASSSGSLAVGPGGSLALTDELRVGDSGSGTLTISGGTVSNTYGNIAREAGSTGTVTLSAGSWTNANTLVVGNKGTGVFNLAGGTATAPSADIGRQEGGVGTANVSGGLWNISGALAVGAGGSGTLNLSDAGTILAGSSVIGRDAGITGSASVSGGTWTSTGMLTIGQSGAGTLTLTGGTVKSSAATLGSLSGSSGTLNLNGGVLETGQLSRGSGSGTFNWNGGTLRLTGDQSALFSGFSVNNPPNIVLGSGAVIDTQGHTVTTAANVAVRGNGGSLTKIGSGTFISLLNTTSPFNLNVNEGTFINRHSLRLSNTAGRLNVATNAGNHATFSMDGLGSLGNPIVTGYALYVGTASGATGAVELLTKGSITMTNHIMVGQNGGTGSFLLDGASASFSTDWGAFGSDGGNGTLTINGGTFTSTSHISFGANSTSTGTLNLNGGTLNLSSVGFGAGHFSTVAAAHAGTATGVANITGGTLNTQYSIVVGGYGVGDFTLSGTGVVNNTGGVILGGWKDIRVTDDGSGGFLTVAVATGNGTATVNGGTWTNGGDVMIGRAATGTLNINGGAFSNENATLGEGAYSYLTPGYDGDYRGSGTANITGGTWTNSGWISVGYQGDGVVNLSGGAMSSAYAALGQQAATTRADAGNGTVNISGGTWTNAGIFNIGESGVGTVNLTGGTLDVGGLVTLAVNATGSGTLNFGAYDLDHATGAGTLNASSIVFGDGEGVINFNQNDAHTLASSVYGYGKIVQRGTGATTLDGTVQASEVTVSGGTLTLAGGVLETGQLARDAASGVFEWTGGTLALTGDQAALFSGFDQVDSGTASIRLSGDATLDTQGFDIATDASATVRATGSGTLTKTGSGTLTWNLRGGFDHFDLNVVEGAFTNRNTIYLATGASGDTGSLHVGGATGASYAQDVSEAQLNAHAVFAGQTAGTTGAMTLTGGAVSATNTFIIGGSGSGSLELDGSGTTLTTGFASIALSAGSSGTVSMKNGSWTTAQLLFGRGVGAMTVTGGQLTAYGLITLGDNSQTGSAPLSTAELAITGGNVKTFSNLLVGAGGTTGTLRLGGTGVLSSGSAYIGYDANSPGHAFVTGGQWSGNTNFNVGYAGAGSLDFTGGTIWAGTSSIGEQQHGVGIATVDGGTWTNFGELRVGNSGTGTLTLTSGTITDTYGNLARNVGSSATVAMSGGTWTNSQWFVVGNAGTATFAQTGGSVAATEFNIGLNTSGTGFATLSGGSWTTASGNLNIGNSGSGTLNLLAGSTVNIGGAATIAVAGNATGVLNFGAYDLAAPTGAGTLNAASIAFGAGAGTINFNQTGALTLGATISGHGAVNQRGAGTTTLTAASTYTGVTTISGGTLRVSDVGAAQSVLGTGAVFVGEAGTLAGVGTIHGDTTIAGTLAPGASPGLLAFTGDLALESTATLLFELGGAERGVTYDAIDVTGDLTYGGALVLSLIDGFTPIEGQQFQLFSVTGTGDVTGAFTSVGFADSDWKAVFDHETGWLTVSAVPEPAAFAALAALAGLATATLRRRRS